MQDWTITRESGTGGTVQSTAPPRFTAQWTAGADADEQAALCGLFWRDEGSGEDDAITLYGFTWQDRPPPQDVFEALMKSAVLAIDEWIAGQL